MATNAGLAWRAGFEGRCFAATGAALRQAPLTELWKQAVEPF